MDYHALLQGIFQTLGIKPMCPGSPALQSDSLPLSHQGSSITQAELIKLLTTDDWLNFQPLSLPCSQDWVGDAAAKSLQSCPTLCDPIDGSPPGSPIPGILQARTLEWVAISFSNVWKWKVKVKGMLGRLRAPILQSDGWLHWQPATTLRCVPKSSH